VACSGDFNFYGLGESLITARLPISVRASTPKFANLGDSFEMSVIVQNLTEKDLQIKYKTVAPSSFNMLTSFSFFAEWLCMC
jgi:uncharacterized protein YfaS (alpha-2-macroglobulin family)